MASILPKQFQEISPVSVVTPVNRLALVFKALSELGPRQLVWYGIHQLGLRTGYYRFATRPESARSNLPAKLNSTLLSLPDRERLEACLGKEGLTGLLAQADEIVAGKFRPFGGEVAPLKLTPSGTPRH